MCTWEPLFRLGVCSWQFLLPLAYMQDTENGLGTKTYNSCLFPNPNPAGDEFEVEPQKPPGEAQGDAARGVMGGSSGAAEEAAGHTCFGVQPPAQGWKQPGSGERISHLRIRDRGPCETLSLLGWASSLGLSQSMASWSIVQDLSHNYLSVNLRIPSPVGRKDDTLSLMSLTFALFWFMGNTQADVYPGSWETLKLMFIQALVPERTVG